MKHILVIGTIMVAFATVVAAGCDGGEGEGEGGEGEGEGPPTCEEECAADADCDIGGNASGLTCQNGRCTGQGCVADGECVALFSGWQQVDTDGDFLGDTACDADHACVGSTSVCVQGAGGRCAADEDADRGGDCTVGGASNNVGVAATDIDGNAHTVCAAPGADDSVCKANGVCLNKCQNGADCGAFLCRIDDGECVECLADADCDAGTLNTCNVELGTCGCGADADCAGDPKGEFCNTSTNQCGCAGDADCTGSFSGDICETSSGLCSCAAATDCNGQQNFDGTSFVCAE